MKLTSVSFKSFRQHRNAEFDFSGDHGDLVVIKGNNGAGKTTFLNGVSWCLYGTIDGSDRYNPTSLVSQSDVVATSPGDEIMTEVSISVALGTGQNATITRRLFFVRTDEGVNVITTELKVLAQEERGAGYVNQSEPKEWIDQKLPVRFSPYFFFDGERLDRFFRESDARFIKDSVLQIAQVDVLSVTMKHLETLSAELTREAARQGGTAGEALADEYERVCNQIEEFETKRRDAAAKVTEATDLVSKAQARLGDIANVAQLMTQRKDVTAQYEGALGRVKGAEDELTSWALQSGPNVILLEALLVLREEIEKARREQVLPPPFDPDALRGLLESGECICGRELDKDGAARSHISHIVEKYGVISEVGDALSRLEGPVLSSLAMVQRGSATSTGILARLKNALADVKALDVKLQTLNQQLAGHDDSQVAILHDQLKKAEAARNAALESRGRFSGEIEHLNDRKGEIERKIASQRTQSIRAADALRKAMFAKKTLELSHKVYEELSNNVRGDVALNLDEQFKKMIWKKDFVDEVNIDENFRVSVVNNRGFEILSELSAGERICLAFAYSLTLATVAGVRFPLVVDSPIGRLGPEVQDNLSRVLVTETASSPDSEEQQLILLMTDTEYTASVQKIFAKRNPMVYAIEFDVKVSETKIVKELN